jgi:hypothetical protein
VTIDPDFAAVVDLTDYHVLLTGYDDFDLRVSDQSSSGFRLALGLNYRGINSDNLILRNLIIQPVQTHLDIKTVGLTYAINYRF